MTDETEPKSKEYFQCPFCKELDFDLRGLKTHYERGRCDEYNTTEEF